MKILLHLFHDISGATAIEYGFIIALIVVGIIGGMTSIGHYVSNSFNSVGNGMTTR